MNEAIHLNEMIRLTFELMGYAVIVFCGYRADANLKKRRKPAMAGAH